MENEKKFAFLKKRRTAFAFVLWLLAMTLLVALFIAKKDEVKQNLEDARVFNKNPPIEAQTPPAPVIASTKDTALFPSATENEIAETAESSECVAVLCRHRKRQRRNACHRGAGNSQI